MKIPVKRNENSQYYFPKSLANVVGEEAEVVPNAYCAVIFPKGSSPRKVLRSLAVIQHDLENQIATEEEEKTSRIEPLQKPAEPVQPAAQEKGAFEKMKARIRK